MGLVHAVYQPLCVLKILFVWSNPLPLALTIFPPFLTHTSLSLSPKTNVLFCGSAGSQKGMKDELKGVVEGDGGEELRF